MLLYAACFMQLILSAYLIDQLIFMLLNGWICLHGVLD